MLNKFHESHHNSGVHFKQGKQKGGMWSLEVAILCMEILQYVECEGE